MKWQEAQTELDTILDFCRWIASQLAAGSVFFGHGTDNPWDEAVALVLQSINLPPDTPNDLFAAKLTTQEKKQIIEFAQRRIEDRTPLPYITHKAYFCGYEFYVDERTLIPRSPIGELISKGFSPWVDIENIDAALELCTGSGCIALAMAAEFPWLTVDATDISLDALEVAEINRQALEAFNCNLIQADVFDGVPAKKYPLIVANPPYVDAEDMADLPEEFSVEPELALAAGDDGLDIAHRILAKAPEFLTEDGVLILEVGNSAAALEEAYPNLPLVWIEFEMGGFGVCLIQAQDLISIAG